MKIRIGRCCLETSELAAVFYIEINDKQIQETHYMETRRFCWLGPVIPRQQPNQTHSQRISPDYPRLKKRILLSKS